MINRTKSKHDKWVNVTHMFTGRSIFLGRDLTFETYKKHTLQTNFNVGFWFYCCAITVILQCIYFCPFIDMSDSGDNLILQLNSTVCRQLLPSASDIMLRMVWKKANTHTKFSFSSRQPLPRNRAKLRLLSLQQLLHRFPLKHQIKKYDN